jgi:hypothetical protein
MRSSVTEAQFQGAVVDLARYAGWHVHHVRPAREASGSIATPILGNPGFPDLVLAHDDLGIVFAELKTATGRPSPAQVDWLTLLGAHHQDVYLWRPSDWDTISQRLTGGRL